MNVRQNLGHGSASLRQLVIHEVLCLQVRNQVCRSDREAGEQIELRDHGLNVVNQLSAAVGAEVIVHHVNQLATLGLVHHARGQLAILNGHGRLHRHHREGGGDKLGASPVLALPQERTLQACEHVHSNDLRHLDARLADAEDAGHGVLEQLNDGAVGAGADDIAEQGCQVAKFGCGCDGLRHVHVHLVSVKVGVIGTGGRNVQTEGAVRQNTHTVGHHRRLVKRRLTVEQHNVSVNEVAVDHIALANINRIWTDKAKVHHTGILLEEH